MNRSFSNPLLLTFIALTIVSTPVTYRGGAAAPHPHMFLQLWEDASTGSFTHHSHVKDHSSRLSEAQNGDHTYSGGLDLEPLEDVKRPVATAFVVSDWSVQALYGATIHVVSVNQHGSESIVVGRSKLPQSHPTPEIPPPQIPQR